jgi:curved DNA-binding protein CbpA
LQDHVLTVILCVGVARDAQDHEVKKAYKKLALRWHPDKNPDTRDEAEAVFKRVSEAYDVLSDPEKRNTYNMYGKSAFEGGRGPAPDPSMGGGAYYRPQGGFHFRRAEDIFAEFFGGRDPFAMFDDPFFNRGGMGQGGMAGGMGGMGSRGRGGMGMMSPFGGMGMFGESPFDDPFFSNAGGGGGSGFSFSMSSSSSSSFGGRGGVSKSVKVLDCLCFPSYCICT